MGRMTIGQQLAAVFAEFQAAVRQVPVAMNRWARDQHAPFDLAGDGSGPAVCRHCKTSWPCKRYVSLDAQLDERTSAEPSTT